MKGQDRGPARDGSPRTGGEHELHPTTLHPASSVILRSSPRELHGLPLPVRRKGHDPLVAIEDNGFTFDSWEAEQKMAWLLRTFEDMENGFIYSLLARVFSLAFISNYSTFDRRQQTTADNRS